MPYFSYLPNIDLAVRPIKFPWSEQQYKVAKNIFRRFKLSESALDTATYFKKYVIDDSDRPDIVSEIVYGRSDYDWIIMMCNNIINPYFDWPMSTSVLMEYIQTKYDNPYSIKHYVTKEVKDSEDNVVLPAGQIVDESFYNSPMWVEYNRSDVDFPTPDNETTLEVSRKLEITSVRLMNCSWGVCTTSNSSGGGFEEPPIIGFSAPGGDFGPLPAVRATGYAVLSETGYLKRIEVTSPGENYTYPPIVTFDGGLAGLSATSVINSEGQVTEIRLDGVKYDTTVADNIYEFGNGATIAPNGSGQGMGGGFDVGGTHLRFGDTYGTRYATLNSVDMTAFDTVRVYAVRGNGSNGGETPDINGVEDLYLRYQITEGAPDPNNWVNLGIVIQAVPNGTGTGVLTNYDFVVPPNVRTNNVYFQLYQPGNSGPIYDHYGITTVNFINTSARYTDANVYLANNPLDTTGAGATAKVVLGKSIVDIVITNGGSYNSGYELGISQTGGNPDQRAFLQAIPRESPNTFAVGDEITFSNGTVAEVTSYAPDNSAGPSVSTMTVELKTIDANNPIDGTMSFTSDTSIGIVRSVVSTTLSEPQYVDKLGNLFRYQLNRPSGTSGWEKLVRDGFRYYDPGTQIVVNKLGKDIATPVDYFQYETELNDKKREIYILKKRYIARFLEEMKEQLPYKRSSDFISETLKRSSI
jgi:hypothetical protein